MCETNEDPRLDNGLQEWAWTDFFQRVDCDVRPDQKQQENE